MNHLGNVSVDIYHRHFSEDSLESMKKIDQINSLKIITYVSINSLKSTFSFINENFISKSGEAIIIFGLTGWNSKGSLEELKGIIKNIDGCSNKNINVYIHTRCHIKMLSADENLLLGTQNISQTSCSFSELSELRFDYVFSSHELIMKVNDTGQKISNSIIDEITRDQYSCFNIIKDGVEVLVNWNDVFYWYDYKAIKEHVKAISIAADKVYNLDGIDISEWEVDVGDCVEIAQLFQEIYESSTEENAIEKISDFLLLVTGNDSCLIDEISIFNVVDEILKSLEKVTLLNDGVQSYIEVLEIFTDISISDIDKSDFSFFLERVKEVIFNAEAFDKKNLVEFMDFEVVSQIESSLGDYDLSKYLDNDANISSESIQLAIYNDDISLDQRICTLSEHLKETSLKVIEVILEEFKLINNTRIVKAKEMLDLKIGSEAYSSKIMV
ncbi:MAG: hypothetical protein KJ609_05255 [Gammaproteobacteria bacterium]|nr:hypothetical protein [Gammaproteobacteria bacterium]MBU2237220.1 hypothetical protein [Gammaproteobacteria bacterium]MBU2317936.1 hypothetical protein [Gammaproteobacteria bacterium]MBU2414167.1 hypothetical protein [Gammaproteobacteria bacterium]